MDKHGKEFAEITGANEAQTAFYLDVAKGDLALALETFYAAGATDMGRVSSQKSSTADDRSSMRNETLGMYERNESPGSLNGGSSLNPSRGTSNSNSRIRTFAQLNNNTPDTEFDGGEDAEEGQDYFAGGEKSGVMMRGPPKKGEEKKTPQDLIKDILQIASQYVIYADVCSFQ